MHSVLIALLISLCLGHNNNNSIVQKSSSKKWLVYKRMESVLGEKVSQHIAKEQVVLLEHKLKRKSKFKYLKLNYEIQFLNWDDKQQKRNFKTYYELRCTIHNIQVDLDKEFQQLIGCEDKTDTVLKSCTCLVSAREVFEKLLNSENPYHVLYDVTNEGNKEEKQEQKLYCKPHENADQIAETKLVLVFS